MSREPLLLLRFSSDQRSSHTGMVTAVLQTLNSTQLNSTQLNSTQLKSTQLNSTHTYSRLWAPSKGHFRVIGAVVGVCRLLAFGQDPLQAVAGPRVHHQLLPDSVGAEHWSVTSNAGPSFMVPDAEVQVSLRLTYLQSCLSVPVSVLLCLCCCACVGASCVGV